MTQRKLTQGQADEIRILRKNKPNLSYAQIIMKMHLPVTVNVIRRIIAGEVYVKPDHRTSSKITFTQAMEIRSRLRIKMSRLIKELGLSPRDYRQVRGILHRQMAKEYKVGADTIRRIHDNRAWRLIPRNIYVERDALRDVQKKVPLQNTGS